MVHSPSVNGPLTLPFQDARSLKEQRESLPIYKLKQQLVAAVNDNQVRSIGVWMVVGGMDWRWWYGCAEGSISSARIAHVVSCLEGYGDNLCKAYC